MTIGKKIGGGFGMALAILLVIGFLTYRSTTKLIETNRLVAHTYEVLADLEALLSTLKDAETGQRGFLITGDEPYLEPYHAALAKIDSIVKELRRLTSDNLNQQRRLDVLEPLISKKVEELKETIEARKQKEKGFEAALQIVRTDKGKKVMDDVRKVV